MLKDKLRDLEQIFNIPRILETNVTKSYTKTYYQTSKWAYRTFHSKKGYMHMGISETPKYHKRDLEKPLLLIENYIQGTTTAKVLELAGGLGANTLFLARRHKNCTFSIVDINKMPHNISKKFPNNVKTYQGDFHDLGFFDPKEFGLVFIIEALCHAKNPARVLQEVHRVLKPKGRFIIFDAYYKKSRRMLSKEERLATRLVEISMAVNQFQELARFQQNANRKFLIREEKDFSTKILPTLKKLETLASRAIRLGKIAPEILQLVPEKVRLNILAGYLMPELITGEIAGYYMHVLESKETEKQDPVDVKT